jgi:hypothetical protein
MSKENKPEHPHGQPPKGKPDGPPSPPGLGKDKPTKVDEKKFA